MYFFYATLAFSIAIAIFGLYLIIRAKKKGPPTP